MVTDPEETDKNEFEPNFMLSLTISVRQWLSRAFAYLEVISAD
jgi:hypothetical protein